MKTNIGDLIIAVACLLAYATSQLAVGAGVSTPSTPITPSSKTSLESRPPIIPCATVAPMFRRANATLDDIFAASCRVNVSGARGSGTFIGVYDGVAYVLTNYHVVENNKTASCDFWTNGIQQTVNGSVAWRAYDASMPADFAIIALDAQELKKIDPPYVALAGRDGKPSTNSVFLSAGGPKGWSVKAWRGTTLGYDGNTARFRPHPVPGQSGSGIFEEIDGACWLVGVVTWLIGTENDDNSTGGAIPIANLYKAGDKRPIQSTDEGKSAIPEGAIECQELAPFDEPRETVYQPVKIVVFTLNNCPACDAIKPDLLQLHAANFPIYACNFGDQLEPGAEPDKNQKLALAYGVTEFPTVIILQNDSTPLVRIDYKTLSEQGAFKAISEAYSAVATDTAIDTPGTIEEAPRDEQSANNGPTTGSSLECEGETCPLIIDGTESMTLKPYGETGTSRIYTNPDDVGIFDDSEERWRNRKQETPPSAPSQESNNEVQNLGDRLTARIVAGLSKQIEQSTAQIGERVQGAIVDGMGEASTALVDKIENDVKARANGVIKEVAWRAFLLIFWAVIFAQFVWYGVKAFVCRFFQRLQSIAQELQEFHETRASNGRN